MIGLLKYSTILLQVLRLVWIALQVTAYLLLYRERFSFQNLESLFNYL